LFLLDKVASIAPEDPKAQCTRPGSCAGREERKRGRFQMHNEFTAIIERDGEWHIAYCPEIPGANGQGHTKEEARENLADAIALILEDRREDAMRGLPADAVRERVTVE